MKYTVAIILGIVSIAYFIWLSGKVASDLEESTHGNIDGSLKSGQEDKTHKTQTAKRSLAQKDSATSVSSGLSWERQERSKSGDYVRVLKNTNYMAKGSLLKASDNFIAKHARDLFSNASPDQFKRATKQEPEGTGLRKVSYEQWLNGVKVLAAGVDMIYNDDGTLLQVNARVATENTRRSPSSNTGLGSISKENALEHVWSAVVGEDTKYANQEGLREKISKTGAFHYYLDDYGRGHRLTQVYRFIGNLETGVAYEYIVDAAKGRSGLAMKRSLIVH